MFVSRQGAEEGNFRMYADGTGVRRVVDDPFSREIRGIFTPVSPDGKWLVLAKYAGTNFDLYKLDMNGREQRLTRTPYAEISPAWSPDGKWIAFVAAPAGNYDIYKMRADGSDVQRLTDSPADEVSPAWLPIADLAWRYEVNAALGLLLVVLGGLMRPPANLFRGQVTGFNP